MQALVQNGYGLAALALSEVATPAVGDDGILVKIHAASVNALDWHMTRGMPYLLRMMPVANVRGVDLAGRVEAVGKDVTRFRPGDDVFGGTDGSFAEYTVTKEERLAVKPPGVTYEQAATCHIAGLTALQGLRDRGQLRAGQRVLIHGAGGGVGTFAVQLAKWLGAHVTAVTRTENVDFLRSLGADAVIDYRSEDFTRRPERYDLFYDISGTRSFADCRRVLTRNGILVVIGGPAGRWLAPVDRMAKAAVLSSFASQRLLPFVSRNDSTGLALLADLTAAGTITPVIDRRYALRDAAEAIRYVGTGDVRGKVVVSAIADSW